MVKLFKYDIKIASVVMKAVSALQRAKENATAKDIKMYIYDKYGDRSNGILNIVPVYLKRGINLGIIGKFKNNYRTCKYIVKLSKTRKLKAKKKKPRRRP